MSGPAKPTAKIPWATLLGVIAVPAVPVVITVMAFVVLPAYRDHRLLAYGAPATAIVQSFEDTSEREGGLPMEDVHILVTPPGGTPYEAVMREQFSPQNFYFFAPGKQFTVKYDKNNPSRVIVPLGQTD